MCFYVYVNVEKLLFFLMWKNYCFLMTSNLNLELQLKFTLKDLYNDYLFVGIRDILLGCSRLLYVYMYGII